MLARSKRSAFVMASVTALTYFATDLFISLATRYAMTGAAPSLQEEINKIQWSWQTLIVYIAALLILIGLGGLMIHALFSSDIHFGMNGVVRWALFGIVDALLVEIYPSIWTTRSHVLQEVIELVIVPISYVIVFKIFPFSRKEKVTSV